MVFCSQHAEIPDNCEKAADSSDAEYDDDFEEYDSSEVSKGTLYLPYIIFLKKISKYNIFIYIIEFTLIFMQIKFWKGLEVQKDIEFDICWQDFIFILQDLDDIVNQAREAQELEPVDVFFADDKILQKQFRQTAIFNRYLYNFFYDLHLISVYKCIRIREIHLLCTYLHVYFTL